MSTNIVNNLDRSGNEYNINQDRKVYSANGIVYITKPKTTTEAEETKIGKIIWLTNQET